MTDEQFWGRVAKLGTVFG